MDKIQILSENLCNQIAAGEVILNPSSVVKELLENSVDAGSTEIVLNIENGGKTLIQVIDNGEGMSERDVCTCIKKHATSKIKNTDDLYNIRTMGFRGEAIASIISVSQSEIITKTDDVEFGTKIIVEGSNIILKEHVLAKRGTSFSVKNIFYNIPARRAFLKSDQIETSYIIKEFQNIALSFPNIMFKMIEDGKIKYDLKQCKMLERISNIFYNKNKETLIPCEEDIQLAKISGYICNPSNVKINDCRFLFVNRRFIKNNDIKNKIFEAYGNLIPWDKKPFYVLFLEISPNDIDINISPTKTEIKFKNEEFIYTFINRVVKKALFHFEIPEIDFNVDNNTFERSICEDEDVVIHKDDTDESILFDNYKNVENKKNRITENFLIINDSYLLSNVKSGLLLININRALKRIIFDDILNNLKKCSIKSQQLLFPHKMFLSVENIVLIKKHVEIFNRIGFTIDFGNVDSLIVSGIPNFLSEENINESIENITDLLLEENIDVLLENIALELISATRKSYIVSDLDKTNLVNKLFSCQNNMYDPFSKRIFIIADTNILDSLLDT